VARRPASELKWGGPRVALVAILALAAALRLVGIRYGLPFPLLNPDEQSIVPEAWRMTHGGGLDPDPFFDYPAALMEILAPFQAWADAPSYLAARIVAVALGVGAVAASWWLGRRAYGPVAGAVAAAVVAVETTHVAYSRMAVTDVPLTLAVAAALALMVAGRLEWAGAAAGLGAGIKYPGVFLLVPLLVAGWAEKRRLVPAFALAAITFAATNPFFFAHLGEGLDDANRVQRLARDGWLGFERDHAAPIAFLYHFWEGMGPALLVAGIGLALALARRRRVDVILASFVLVYFADLLTLHAHFDRYTLPLVPALGTLAGRLRGLAPVTLLLLAVPLTWAIRDDIELTRTDTRIVAHRWIERHLPPGATIAVEPSTPPLAGFRVLPLALPGPKRSSDPNRDPARLRARGVRYVLVTGEVADRVLAARDLYPAETRFYTSLERTRPIYRIDEGAGLSGPWVAVYRL
jgi:4-amino-4-deoxy-L-arabinose transferase-like glycosyltransferase